MPSSPLLSFPFLLSFFFSFVLCHSSRHELAIQTLIPSRTSSSEQEVASESLKVLHRDISHSDFLSLDEARAKSIHRRRSSRTATLPARSGIALGTGNYVVTLGIGTPKKDVTVVFDTGSDLTWIQCEPCIGSCYSQQGSIFNPSNSSSYRNITCDSPDCSSLTSSTGRNPGCYSGTCVYAVRYGDGSYSVGFYSQETISFGGKDSFQGIKFGCGENNKGLFGLSSGLLGLGRDEISLVSQTASKYKKVFSYCLPSSQSKIGYLRMGPVSRNSKITYTKMLTDPSLPSFYFVELVGITVGRQRLRIKPSVFQTAGTILDSGTVITRLPPAAYSALRSAFRKELSKYPEAPALSILDTCYNFTGYETISVSKISLNFKGNVSLEVHSSGILYAAKISQACLAFAGNEDPSSVGIIGNAQQKTYQVVYDLAREGIGFGAAGCV